MIRCNQCEKISNCPYGIQDGESIVSTCDDFSFNLAEHDKQIRADAIDDFANWLKEKGIHGSKEYTRILRMYEEELKGAEQ